MNMENMETIIIDGVKLPDPNKIVILDDSFNFNKAKESKETRTKTNEELYAEAYNSKEAKEEKAKILSIGTRAEVTDVSNVISPIDFIILDKNGFPIAINYSILASYILQQEQIRFVEAQKGGVFYRYSTEKSRWEELTESGLNRIILKHVQDTNLRKTANKMLSEVKTFLAAAEGILVTFSDFNNLRDKQNKRDKHIVNCLNGVYNADTNELEEHNSSNLFTSTINANYLSREVFLDEAPVFKNFLETSLVDEQLILFVQEMLGYCLTWDINAKCFFVNDGATDSGKSTIANFIKELITCDFVSSLDWQDFQSKKDIIELYGKMINISGDLPKDPITNKDKIKCLTGGDLVSGWRLFIGNVSFTNKAKIICNTNGMPDNYGDKSPAFYNRLKVIPYRFTLPKSKQDKNLVTKLMKEKDVIFTWAMQGYRRLVQNNYIFTSCSLVEDAVSTYKNKSSLVAQFVDDLCIINAEASIQKRWLFEQFVEFANKETGGSYKTSSKIFYKELLETYPELKETKDSSQGGRWVFKGIKLA